MADEDGGYDANFVIEIPELLKCCVCHFALKNPVQFIECGHRLCKCCFEKMKQFSITRGNALLCPLDRKEIALDKVFPDIGVERAVFDLQVKCNNQVKGCEWIGDLRSLQSHTESVCPYGMVSCSNDCCESKMQRRELKRHLLSCSLSAHNEFYFWHKK